MITKERLQSFDLHLLMKFCWSRVKRAEGANTSVRSRKMAQPCFRMHTYTSARVSHVTFSISFLSLDGRDQSCRPFCQFNLRLLFSNVVNSSSSKKMSEAASLTSFELEDMFRCFCVLFFSALQFLVLCPFSFCSCYALPPVPGDFELAPVVEIA